MDELLFQTLSCFTWMVYGRCWCSGILNSTVTILIQNLSFKGLRKSPKYSDFYFYFFWSATFLRPLLNYSTTSVGTSVPSQCWETIKIWFSRGKIKSFLPMFSKHLMEARGWICVKLPCVWENNQINESVFWILFKLMCILTQHGRPL